MDTFSLHKKKKKKKSHLQHGPTNGNDGSDNLQHYIGGFKIKDLVKRFSLKFKVHKYSTINYFYLIKRACTVSQVYVYWLINYSWVIWVSLNFVSDSSFYVFISLVLLFTSDH